MANLTETARSVLQNKGKKALNETDTTGPGMETKLASQASDKGQYGDKFSAGKTEDDVNPSTPAKLSKKTPSTGGFKDLNPPGPEKLTSNGFTKEDEDKKNFFDKFKKGKKKDDDDKDDKDTSDKDDDDDKDDKKKKGGKICITQEEFKSLGVDVGDSIMVESEEDGEIELQITDFIGFENGDVTDVVVEDADGEEYVIPILDIMFEKHQSVRNNRFADDHDTAKGKRAQSFARKIKDKKKCSESVVTEDETIAQDSLAPKSHPVDDPKSRLEYIKTMIGTMYQMGNSDLIDFFNKSMAQVGHQATDVSAETNRASLKTFPSAAVAKEDVAELFDGQDLSEEFKERTTVLFEAAINAKMMVEEERLAGLFAEMLSEEIEKHEQILAEEVAELNEKVETYLDYVATSWLEENEVAVESAIRNELAANFMSGLRDLFLENFIDIPEEAVDVVSELSATNKELEDKLNEAIAEIASLKQDITEATAEELFAEVATGLPASQVEKFRILSEGVEFLGDGDKFKEKLATIKTAHFKNENKRVPTVRFEDSFDEGNLRDLNENLDPQMKGYVGALSRYKPRQVEVKK